MTTTRVQRCECCDLPARSCGKAKEDTQRKIDRQHRLYLVKNGWFASSYPGACARCGEAFKPGTLIHADGLKFYLAQCCAPEMP